MSASIDKLLIRVYNRDIVIGKLFEKNILGRKEFPPPNCLLVLINSSVTEMIIKRGKDLTKIRTISSPIHILLFLLFVLNLADIATTIYGFSLGAGELNPLFQGKSIITTGSLITKICLTLIFISIFTMSYKLCPQKYFAEGRWILNTNLVIVVGMYLGVVINNLTLIIAMVLR